MKIDPTGTARTSHAATTKRVAKSKGGTFSSELGSANDIPGGGTPSVAGTDSIDALLAVQEVPDSLAGHQQAWHRAEDLLDRLDDIRDGLLRGAIPRHRLTELARIVRARQGQIGDPRLKQVLEEIELRAAVELEKLSYGQNPSNSV